MSDKLKKCCRCKEFKTVDEFYKNKSTKDGLAWACKSCKNIFQKEYSKTFKGQKYYKKYSIIYRKEHKEELLKYSYNYYKGRWNKLPWEKTYWNIVSRCNYKSHGRYPIYGGRGIKCLITKEELKQLWFRDKAYNLQQASIDRKNPDGDYIFDNCRYIEMAENRRNHRKIIPKNIKINDMET